jgi:hypothetical protein
MKLSSLATIALASLTALSSLPAFASPSYSCCFKRADGTERRYKSRASTYYTGSVARLCKSVALESKYQQCDSDLVVTEFNNTLELDLYLTAQPAEVDLSTNCKVYPCSVGVYVANNTAVYVANTGRANCSVKKEIFSESGLEEHTIKIELGSFRWPSQGSMGGCSLVTIGTSGVTTTLLKTNIVKSNLQEYLDRAKARDEKQKKEDAEETEPVAPTLPATPAAPAAPNAPSTNSK